ncbi:CSN5, partial [Symbiodinium necroappetens]
MLACKSANVEPNRVHIHDAPLAPDHRMARLNIEQVGLEDFDEEEEIELGQTEQQKQESATRNLTEGDDALREVLKKFERKEPSLMACAATNLSFLYFLEAEHTQAEKYADIAVKADRYNARALVNKGNCMFMNDEFERAKEVYLEAIGVSADCLEAIYNLGLVNMHIGKYQEALLAFDKLHSITHVNCEVMWQLGDIHEKLGNHAKAHEWFSLLVTSPKGRPTDPGVLARLANLFNKAGDETQAFHYHLESYRYWPVDMNVITWLGIYYVKQEMYEAAIPFFSRASQIEPNEVKWRLMVASCYRRMGAYPAALKLYEDIHRSHPNDIECVRYLITICKEMKQKYDHYAAHLRKLERLQAANEQPGRNMGTVSAIGQGGLEDSPRGDSGDMGGFGGSRGRFDHDEDDPPPPPEAPRPPVELYEAEADLPAKGDVGSKVSRYSCEGRKGRNLEARTGATMTSETSCLRCDISRMRLATCRDSRDAVQKAQGSETLTADSQGERDANEHICGCIVPYSVTLNVSPGIFASRLSHAVPPMASTAQKTWELENQVVQIDDAAIYAFDQAEQDAIYDKKPWREDVHFFKNVRMSAIALIKIMMHTKSGAPLEVMGLMQGKVTPDRTFIIMDAFPLPVEGTETRVNAGAGANEFMVTFTETCERIGKVENICGWYHSHPGYGCWLSGIDVQTQMTYQQHQEPFLAVVVDPVRTCASGKVDIGAFRTYPAGYSPPDEGPGEYQSIPLDKIEDFGVHCKQYYTLPIEIFKNSL